MGGTEHRFGRAGETIPDKAEQWGKPQEAQAAVQSCVGRPGHMHASLCCGNTGHCAHQYVCHPVAQSPKPICVHHAICSRS